MSLLAGSLMLLGSLLAVLAGIGLVRFPDALSRLQAATKLQVPGLVLVLVGAALVAGSTGRVALLLLVVLFQLVTVPVLGQVVGRAAYRTGELRSDLVARDEPRPPG